MVRPTLLFLALLGPSVAPAQAPRPAPTRVDLGDGIYLFQTQPYGDVGLDGNAVVIVSTDGVLVFDSNGTPAGAAAVLAEIRKLTDQPVRYLVNSHWHWDHWYGAEVYRQAFPGLEIITHEASRRLMSGPALAFNQPGLDTQLPEHIRAVEAALAKAKAARPPSPDVARLEAHLANDRFFLAQKRSVHPTLATLTFTDSLTIYLGQRVIKVLHHDRAITPGDTYLYLPAERTVILGDLLINPITFALFCYPTGWIATLRSIAALDARLLVPGHGAPLHDGRLLDATIALLEREQALAGDLRARGQSVDQAKTAILADSTVLAWRDSITGGDHGRDPAFALYLVDWFVRRVYQELAGPLDDSIPALP
jgi:cyclase